MSQTFGTITTSLAMVTKFWDSAPKVKLLVKLQILFIKTVTVLFSVYKPTI